MGDTSDPAPADGDSTESGGTPPPPGPEPTREPGWSAQQPPPWSGVPGWTAPGGAAPSDRGAPAAGHQGWGRPAAWRPEVKPGVIPLRPLGVGEILDGAISAIRAHPKVMLGISAMVGIVAAVLSGLSDWFAFRGGSTGLTTEENLDASAIAALGVTGAGVLITSLAALMATGMLTVVLGRAVLGQDISLGDAWQQAKKFIWRLIGLWLLTGLIVAGLVAGGILVAVVVVAVLGNPGIVLGVLAGIAGVVLGLYFYVKFWLAAPALVLEKQPIVKALRRSSRLVKASWWRVFGILLLTAILAGIIGQVLQAPFSLLSYGTSLFDTTDIEEPSLLELTAASVGVLIAQAVTLPFQAGVTALLYIDQRMRKEGLDIELARASSSAASEHPAR